MDSQLRELLQVDGRSDFTRLASRTGMTRASVAALVKNAIADGSLKITTTVHPAISGRTLVAHISIWIVGDIQPIQETALGERAVTFFSVIGGLYSAVAEVRCSSLHELSELCERFRRTKDVEAINVLTYGSIHRMAGVNVREPAPSRVLDPLDRRLIHALQANGRATFDDLAKAAETSTSSAANRVRRLIQEGSIHVGAMAGRHAQSHTIAMGAGLNVNGSALPLLEKLCELPNVEFAATTLGRFDAVVTFSADSLGGLSQTLANIRGHSAVTSVETWIHLETLREEYGLQD